MKKVLTLILSVLLSIVAVFASACSPELEKGKVNIKYYQEAKDVVLSIMGGS